MVSGGSNGPVPKIWEGPGLEILKSGIRDKDRDQALRNAGIPDSASETDFFPCRLLVSRNFLCKGKQQYVLYNLLLWQVNSILFSFRYGWNQEYLENWLDILLKTRSKPIFSVQSESRCNICKNTRVLTAPSTDGFLEQWKRPPNE